MGCAQSIDDEALDGEGMHEHEDESVDTPTPAAPHQETNAPTTATTAPSKPVASAKQSASTAAAEVQSKMKNKKPLMVAESPQLPKRTDVAKNVLQDQLDVYKQSHPRPSVDEKDPVKLKAIRESVTAAPSTSNSNEDDDAEKPDKQHKTNGHANAAATTTSSSIVNNSNTTLPTNAVNNEKLPNSHVDSVETKCLTTSASDLHVHSKTESSSSMATTTTFSSSGLSTAAFSSSSSASAIAVSDISAALAPVLPSHIVTPLLHYEPRSSASASAPRGSAIFNVSDTSALSSVSSVSSAPRSGIVCPNASAAAFSPATSRVDTRH